MPAPDTDKIVARDFDVFVSYRHLDSDVRDVLVAALEAAGLSVWWDAGLVSEEFRPQLAERIRTCKVVVALWSRQVAKKPEEVADEMAQARGLKRLIALKTDDAPIPDRFREQNFMPFDGWSDLPRRRTQLDAIVTEVRRRIDAPAFVVTATGAGASTLVADPVFGDIPGAPPKLIGRDAELAMLRGAWDSKAPKKVNAVVLHALGGAGKSALLRTFANELLAGGGGGARRIYGWSAYSQGSGEQKRADADGFISKALGDLGFKGDPPKDPVERAREFAKLVQKERVLLLLDGLEPLQDPPGVNKGRFKDKGLAELVKVLAKVNPGLVVLTTRQEVPELEGHGALVIAHSLNQLTDKAGAELLVELGVRGRQKELEAAVREIDGHALSVTLLGTYLSEVCGGDIRHRDQFDFSDIVLTHAEEQELASDETVKYAKRAEKIMRGYLEQFDRLGKDEASKGPGGPERAILNLLGLFDRPADGKAVEALLAKRIPGLTDDLFVETVTTTSGKWFWKSSKVEVRELDARERGQRLRRAKERLRKLRLLSKPNPHDPQELDAHPIVRAFFSGRLDETAPEGAKVAHDILYKHYSAAAPDLPDTLEEMKPLFHAVQHGVKAGYVHDCFTHIYLGRIQRGSEFFTYRLIGATSADLGVLANFYRILWTVPISELNSNDQAAALARAAFALEGIGRLKDALGPRKASVTARAELGDWRNAANNADVLAQTLLMFGDISSSIEAANVAFKYASMADSDELKTLAIQELANAYIQNGRLENAQKLYAELADRGNGFTSIPGYQYGLLLLSQGHLHKALDLGKFLLQYGERNLGAGASRADIGFAHLLLACANDALDERTASASYDESVLVLRQSGRAKFLPEALLARAAHRRERAAAGEAGLIDKIQEDLAEVEDIAGTEMRLYLTDLALECARVALDLPGAFDSPELARAEAVSRTAEAARLIEETGYHRRDGELADLQRRLAG